MNRHETKISPASTNIEIRKYMFGEHNRRTLEWFNGKTTPFLALAYKKSNGREIYTPEYKKTIEENFNIILPKKLEEIYITHNGIIVDTMTEEQLKQCLSNESPNLRQPAA